MARRNFKASFVGTLVFVDEPQLILLERSPDAKIISAAIDDSDYESPFLGAEINSSQWDRYRRGFLDLRYLFLYPRWKRWYLFDLADIEDNFIPLRLADASIYRNESYLPASGFFSRDHTDSIDPIIETKLQTQSYAIDGSWDLPDFSQFYGKVSDLYSFFLSLSEYVSPTTRLDIKKAIGEAFRGHPLRGGSSYVNLYNDLYSAQDFDNRLMVKKIQYASPGHVNVDGRADIFGDIDASLDNFSHNFDSIREEYLQIHKYLSESRLLKKSSDEISDNDPLGKYILKISKEFADIMNLDQFDLIYKMTDKKPLSAVKILLSYYRRMERYYMFFAEGRVRAPQHTKS